MKSKTGIFRLLAVLCIGLTLGSSGVRANTAVFSGSNPGPNGGIVFLASLPLFAIESVRDTAYTIGNLFSGNDRFIGGFFIGFGDDLQNALQNGPFAPYGGDPVGSITTNAQGETALAVYSGELTLNFPDGKQLVIKGGEVTILNKNNPSESVVQPISQLMQNEAYRGMLMEAVTTTAQLAASSTAANSADLSRALAAIVQTVSAADPAAAQTIVAAAVNELTKGGQDNASTVQSINTVVAAAANGSNTDASVLAEQALATAASNGAAGVTSTALSSTENQQALRNVFAGDSASNPIDVTIMSPSG